MLPSLSMPLPSNHYLLKIHFNLPRNIRYTIPFPIPPERVIQELEVLANPAEQAFPGKHASTSSTRSQHAASRQDSFTRSNTPAKCSGQPASCSGQSGPGSVCCSGWTASQLLFVFFLCCLLCFLLLQKTNQTATTKINVKFDHGHVTARLDHVCLLFPAWPMNGELVSVRLYSLWDEEASRISVVFTDEGFVEIVFEKPRGSPPKSSV